MISLINLISTWAVPLILLIIPTIGFLRKVPVYESFITGAKEGFTTAIRIIPYLVAMFIAIKIFQASGAMNFIIQLLTPITNLLKIPSEVLPLAFIRPLSGSGALGMLATILETYGPDSLIGRVASTIQGSTETTFYVITVYLGAVGIRKVRHSLPASIVGDIAGLLASVYIVTKFFS